MRTRLLLLFFSICNLANAQTASWEWAKSAGQYTSHDYCNSIAADLNGNSYITGHFQDTIVFGNTTLINNTNYNEIMYLAKYDSSGNAIWALQSNGSINELGNGISLDGSGNIYIAGDFSSPNSIFGAATLVNSDLFLGSYDLFIAKIKMQTVTSVSEEEPLINAIVFPNPFSDKAVLKFENSKAEKYKINLIEFWNYISMHAGIAES